MTSMKISLPDSMKNWVESQINSGGYDTASEYVQDLIRRDQDRAAKVASMQRLVDEAMKSGDGDKSLAEIHRLARERAQTRA